MRKDIDYLQILSKEVANEGIVLLKNGCLPLKGKINLFGRIQFNYYKSGTGSGGLVNTDYVYSLYDIISSSKELIINEELANVYKEFVKENPFNHGNGTWASEPWSQEEMEVSEVLVKSAKKYSDVAVVLIGRTAGEDKDFKNERGSYKLSLKELNLIKAIKKEFDKIVLVLNVGTIIDLSEVVNDVSAILLAYHGGYYGALSIYETLIGLNNPSGSLPFTVLKDITKDPSFKNFGQKESLYKEDIFVGYRYFHTFAEENILYPIGFGLSYTDFSLKIKNVVVKESNLKVNLSIKNIGNIAGKKALILYLEKPNNKLEGPKYSIIDFYKSVLLKPNETENIEIEIDLSISSAFDEKGAILKNHYLYEKGNYTLYLGKDLHDNDESVSFKLTEDLIFNEGKLIPLEKEFTTINNEKVQEVAFIEENISNEKYLYKENSYTFKDINEVGVDKFIEGLTDEDLTHLIKGEGMSSPKGTPGIAAVVGGLTERLKEKEIPIIGFADGPSGIRMDSGFYASSLPNGALLASTFNLPLIEKLYTYVGYEMDNYNILVLLGPGMNIYRSPLCGRNFEYFSEDPLITGLIASAVIKGLHNANKYGSLKHLMLNNQENRRFENEVWASNRAIREIYLRPFEIAIKKANAQVIMSSYNYINGYHSLSHPTLFKLIREEFNFKGIFISDWWAHVNNINEELCKSKLSKMVKANHDLYMVVENTITHENDLLEALKNKEITRDELVSLAKNILMFIHDSKKVNHDKKAIPKLKYPHLINEVDLDEFNNLTENVLKENDNHIYYIKKVVPNTKIELPKLELIKVENGHYIGEQITGEKGLIKHYKLEVFEDGKYGFNLKLKNEGEELSQLSINIYFNGIYEQTYTYGYFKDILQATIFKLLKKGVVTFSIEFRQKGLVVESIYIFKHP